MNKIGFYFNCYKNNFATDNILNIIRNFYPNNPIFLMCDNGNNFTDIAKKYNCIYYYSSINILGGKLINGNRYMGFSNSTCLIEYLKILEIAIKMCNSEYIVFMEDDSILINHINNFPLHSGGDININYFESLLTEEGFKIFKNKYPYAKFNYWNMAGGSIIHCQTLLECIQNTNINDILFFDKYSTHPLGFCHMNDIALSLLLLINGKTNEKWTNTTKSNILHPDKRFYNKNLTVSDGVFRNKI